MSNRDTNNGHNVINPRLHSITSHIVMPGDERCERAISACRNAGTEVERSMRREAFGRILSRLRRSKSVCASC